MATVKRTHPARYRVYQFLVAIKATLTGWTGVGRGGLSVQDRALVQAILPTPDQRQLFYRMAANDQRHAVAVARTLQTAGYTDPTLMQAALLHDVAKSLGQPIIHRVLIVLFEAFWPAALTRLSVAPSSAQIEVQKSFFQSFLAEIRRHLPFGLGDFFPNLSSPNSQIPAKAFVGNYTSIGLVARWWRRPFVVHAHHAAIGAGWAKNAGCDPVAVDLIARHQDRLPADPVDPAEKLLIALQRADNLN